MYTYVTIALYLLRKTRELAKCCVFLFTSTLK